jgi:hypothetical protein
MKPLFKMGENKIWVLITPVISGKKRKSGKTYWK